VDSFPLTASAGLFKILAKCNHHKELTTSATRQKDKVVSLSISRHCSETWERLRLELWLVNVNMKEKF